MHRCHIALGGNLGDVRQTFASALRLLAGPDLNVVTVSRLYATPPMGSRSGGAFLNAAATLETELSPAALLERLLSIETDLGRTRKIHWGPRPIDLDLILCGEAIIEQPRLRLPHPACWHRRFVLDPLAEIAPEAIHPEANETVAGLRNLLLDRPLTIAWHAATESFPSVAEEIRRQFGEIVWTAPADATLIFRPGIEGSSPRDRWIGIPDDPGQMQDAVTAVLTAALGIPELTECPISDF